MQVSFQSNSNALANTLISRFHKAAFLGLLDARNTMKAHMLGGISGNITTMQLIAADHPFARRHYQSYLSRKTGNTFTRRKHRLPYPLWPVNKQTGELFNSYFDLYGIGYDYQMWSFGFTSPHIAVLLEGGTSTMVDRNYVQMLMKYMKTPFIAAVQASFNRNFY